MVAILLSLSCLFMFVIAIFLLVSLSEETSFLRRTIDRNKLYICNNVYCKRLYRHYQSTTKENTIKTCPHCDRWTYFPYKKKEKRWMNYHSDCPKLNLKEYIDLILNLTSIKKKKKTVEDIEFFEKYNSRKPNTDWLNNITKNKK